ncbi:hypothetical protein CBR_g26287 [Chara braunii]|uniref:DIRP domain-containing protein n=1 Tax=Chara braunii TaxID=69332 RepID=A0A388L7I0_CHABU|nr:hypothetical protein CBR_g26287 [Chara braunii]|eukprot:GBG78256.1 hypothetical protein CBR_g26287 [Chara braunii]
MCCIDACLLAPRARVSGAGAGEEEDSESRFPLAEHVRDSVSNPSSRTISPVSTPETGHPTGTSGAWSAMSPPSNSQQMSSPSAQVPKDREWAGAGPQTRGRAPQTPGQSGLHLGSSASVSLVQSVSPAGDARSSPTNMSSGAARDGLRSGAIAACSGVAMTASAAANDATAENVSPSGSGAVDARGGCGSVPKEVTKEDGTVKRAVPDDATRREGGGAKAPLEPPPSQPPAQHEGRKRKRKPVPEKLPLITPPPGNKPPDPMIKPRNKPKRITPGRDATPKDGGSKHGLAGQRILRDDGALSLAREGEEVGAVSSGGSELVGTCATPAATGEKSALPLKLRSKKQRMGVATAGSASMSGGPAENGSACDGVENRLPSGAVQGSSGEEIVTHPKGGAEHTRGGTGGSVTTGSEHPTSPKPREPATCAHVTTGLKGASGKARLMHALLSPSVQRWCMCEWFYSDIDLPWFIRNEFVEYLQHLGLGHVTRLTRVEWGEIRSSLGKPRRLSQAFLREERGKLALHRELARNHYQEMRSGVVEGFSQDFAKPLAVGQRVTARHPKKGQIHDGSVLTVDRGRCRVQFDRTDLGVELVEDTDVMPVNPMENLPDTMKRRRMPDGFDDSRNRAGLPLLNGVPATGTFVASGTIGNHFIDQPNVPATTYVGRRTRPQDRELELEPMPVVEKVDTDVEFLLHRHDDPDEEEATRAKEMEDRDRELVERQVAEEEARRAAIPTRRERERNAGTAREADVRALGELARVLDKKDLLLAELRRMNDEVEGGAIAVDGLVGEASSKADAFQRQYATVVLQLKEVNKQVERALLRLRQRNKYHESTLPPWQKGSPQMYSGAGMVYGGIPSSPSNVNDGSHLTASGSGGFGIGMYGGLSSGLPLASARGNGSVFTSGVGVATSGSSAAATGNGSAVMSPVIEAPFPIGEMAASARRQARAMVASVVQAFASEKMEAEDQAGRPTSRESSGEGAMEANGATTSEGGGGAAAGGGVGATATTTGGESGKDSGTADSCPTSKVSSLSRSGRPPLVPPDPLVGINPLIMPGTAKEAALLTELMASCVATLLMVQNCTERSLPHSDVVLTLDSALSSLRPHDSSNSSVFKEIERSIATIKSQIVAEVPATHVP